MTASRGTANKLRLGLMKCRREATAFTVSTPPYSLSEHLNTELTCGPYKDTSEYELRENCQLRCLCWYISTFFNKDELSI